MKVAIAVSGSHGDIRPMVALSQEFKNHGHDVHLIASPGNTAFISKNDITTSICGEDWNAILGQVGTTRNVIKMMNMMRRFLRREVDAQFSQLKNLTEETDLLIGAGFQFAAKSISESMNIPYRHVLHAPQVIRSRYHPPLSAMLFNLPHWMNRLWWCGHCAAYNNFLRANINAQRKQMGLCAISDVWDYLTRQIVIASDKLLGTLPPDANALQIQTGYPYLNEETDLDNRIIDFLENGKPAIYFGFGSAPCFSKTDLSDLMQRITQEYNVKVIVSKGWSNLSLSNKATDVLEIEHAPHSKLFPKLKAVIHHGGAGTTHTAAMSGVPQLIIGFAMDQYYWGNKVYSLSLGPKPMSILTVKPSSLLHRIGELLSNSNYENCARMFSDKMNGSEGTRTTYDYLVSFS